MTKIIVGVGILILGLLVSVQTQTRRPDNREICRRQNQNCLSREARNGRINEVTAIFNQHCRQTNRNWRNVTRCELSLANCKLTLETCAPLNCANVRRTVGGGPGPSNPETTTRGGRVRTTTRRRGPTTRRGRTTPGLPPTDD